MRQAVKLAGRLHDHERHLAVRNGLLEPFQTAGVVADSERSAQRMDEDVEPGFTDVDSEVDLCSDALLRLRALPCMRDSLPIICSGQASKGGRILLTHASKPEGLRSRPPDRLRVATLRRSSQALSRFGTKGIMQGASGAFFPDKSISRKPISTGAAQRRRDDRRRLHLAPGRAMHERMGEEAF
jgi:hypothetical protein